MREGDSCRSKGSLNQREVSSHLPIPVFGMGEERSAQPRRFHTTQMLRSFAESGREETNIFSKERQSKTPVPTYKVRIPLS